LEQQFCKVQLLLQKADVAHNLIICDNTKFII